MVLEEKSKMWKTYNQKTHLSFQLNWAKENTDKSLIKDYHDFKQTKTIHYFSVNITYCLAEVVG